LNAPNLWLLFQPQTCCTTVALGWGIVEVPKSETQVSADLWDEADTIDLAHALADYYGRKVVVVWTDDQEVVVESRVERGLRSGQIDMLY
jgi:hypothetical protein